MRNCFGYCEPIVAVVRDAHDNLLRWNNFHDAFDIAFKEILRRDRPGVRGRVMQVVVHQDYGIGLCRQILVVIAPIPAGTATLA